MNFNKKKFISFIVLVSIVIILLIIQNKNDKLLSGVGHYTVGKIIEKKIVAGAGPTYIYEYNVNNKMFRKKGSSGFKGYENKYYFVIFNPNNPKESEVLINFKVPDSIKEAPEDGWRELPVPYTEEEILKGIK